jgi:hypothetical protein
LISIQNRNDWNIFHQVCSKSDDKKNKYIDELKKISEISVFAVNQYND